MRSSKAPVLKMERFLKFDLEGTHPKASTFHHSFEGLQRAKSDSWTQIEPSNNEKDIMQGRNPGMRFDRVTPRPSGNTRHEFQKVSRTRPTRRRRRPRWPMGSVEFDKACWNPQLVKRKGAVTLIERTDSIVGEIEHSQKERERAMSELRDSRQVTHPV